MIVTIIGYDLEHDVTDPSQDVVSELATVEDALDWVARTAQVDRDHLVVRGSEIWVMGACGVLATFASGELASLPEADRRVAERIADLDEIEPPAGWEDRAVDRARREGVL